MSCLLRIGCVLLVASCSSLLGCRPTESPSLSFPAPRTIDQTNFDPLSLSNEEVSKAASLRVYFEHASVGGNIFCDYPNGFELLRAIDSRFSSQRISWKGGFDPTWFADHAGLADNDRGNPGASEKIRGFASSLAGGIGDRAEVATFKFCWIDTPADADGLFESVRTAMGSLEKAHPSTTLVWWTMPLERDTARSARQSYNDQVRRYCADGNRWLLDIAALESHDESGNLCADSNGRELQCPAYSSDGGHLSDSGKVRLAKAYWRLIAQIAGSR